MNIITYCIGGLAVLMYGAIAFAQFFKPASMLFGNEFSFAVEFFVQRTAVRNFAIALILLSGLITRNQTLTGAVFGIIFTVELLDLLSLMMLREQGKPIEARTLGFIVGMLLLWAYPTYKLFIRQLFTKL